ncbi:hypothetical protein acsn021_40090 [Anaerocolumna cellulosilytica]|uniref:Uncharacterized protein n=1 Tax=Anaerocolumna cellulosilytica TaxID=433286 RepID=A0A6S6RAD7_9FIRM|nr:CAP domain-containing protein [Anaerocolumna cellulosilytica]MBB5197795.1 uncharacterized protein YkwD [Anaerocolumna cellulosilytica]BCJ96440.1 hypothetical protein acsn021_40090 [Anaerocolumna cellulosilytica]
MKRFVATSILTLALISTSIYNPIVFNANATQTAQAATASQIKTGRPALTATNRTATTVTFKINGVNAADGYKIYRAVKRDGTYQYIGYTKSNSYTDKKVKAAGTYYYKARAYDIVKGKKVNSKYSTVTVVTPTMGKPSFITAKAIGKSSVAIVWSNVKNAKSYNVYRSTSVNGTYKYIGNATCNSYTDDGLSDGTTYYYRVRAAKVNNGTKYFGAYSDKTSVTTAGAEVTPTQIPTQTPTKVPTQTPTKTPTPTSSEQTYDSSFASQVLKLVNIERKNGGLSELTMSKALTAPANKRAEEIVQSFSHTRPNGTAWSTVLNEFNVSVTTAGENLAYGYNTPEAVVEGWMNSPGHRANIMNAKFRNIGIGVYKDSNGTVYATQLFSN